MMTDEVKAVQQIFFQTHVENRIRGGRLAGFLISGPLSTCFWNQQISWFSSLRPFPPKKLKHQAHDHPGSME
jgi:hypothetical protein